MYFACTATQLSYAVSVTLNSKIKEPVIEEFLQNIGNYLKFSYKEGILHRKSSTGVYFIAEAEGISR